MTHSFNVHSPTWIEGITSTKDFINSLQKSLEWATRDIYIRRHRAQYGDTWEARSKQNMINEPEDLFTFWEENPEAYCKYISQTFASSQEVFHSWIMISLTLWKEYVREWFDVYFEAIGQVRASMIEAQWGKMSREKLEKRIREELAKMRPYYEKAYHLLLEAENKVGGVVEEVQSDVDETLTHREISSWDKTTSFHWREYPHANDNICYPNIKEHPLYIELIELVKNHIELGRYQDMLLWPLGSAGPNAENDLMLRRIQNNPGMQNVENILKTLLQEYTENPESIISLPYNAFFKVLWRIHTIKWTLQLLDQYERNARQYAIVILCEYILAELCEVYKLKDSPHSLPKSDIQKRADKIIHSVGIIDFLAS